MGKFCENHVPSPSCPDVPRPQVYTLRVVATATWYHPRLTAQISSSPSVGRSTLPGIQQSVSNPVPRTPYLPTPHVYKSPSVVTAADELPLARMALTGFCAKLEMTRRWKALPPAGRPVARPVPVPQTLFGF